MNDEEFLLHEKYDGQCTPEYASDIKKLQSGVPVAYIIGWVPFLDTKIFLESQPLIPRVETEYWVEHAITAIKEEKKKETCTVLDIFSGSGCIGIAVAKHIPQAHVTFADIEEKHLSTIQKNIQENGIPRSHTKLTQSDVFEKITERYDYIFANPPYLSRSRISRLGESVLEHEPHEALFADEGGFSLIRKTLAGLSAHLKDGGMLYIEHEPEHRELLEKTAEELGFHASVKEDQYGIIRYSVVVKRG